MDEILHLKEKCLLFIRNFSSQKMEMKLKANGYTLYCKTDGKLVLDKKDFRENLYFEDDAKDGKVSIGSMVSTYSHHHELKPKETKKVSIIYSMAPIKDSPESIRDKELTRFSDSVKNRYEE